MSWTDDKLTEQFYRWELRGRGWQVREHPVSIEPAFRPFTGHFVPPHPKGDDGRKHTFLSGFIERVGKSLSADEEADGVPTGAEEQEPEPDLWERGEAVESQIILPRERKYSRESFESLLLSLSSCVEPLAFEVLGTQEETILQFAGHAGDASLLRRQVQGRFAGSAVNQSQALPDAWSNAAPSYAIAEFGLEREFMLTLDTSGQWYPGLLAALSDLGEGELGLLQVIFQPVRHRWAESALRAVSNGDGGHFFVNRPILFKEAVRKLDTPLYAVVLRMASSADDSDRAFRIIAEMASGLASLSNPDGNNFVPLANTGYGEEEHQADLMLRQSHRAGMLLNLDELVSLVHFPDASIHAPKLRQDTGRTRALPRSAADGSIVLGENIHAGLCQPVTLSVEQRVRHMHVLGSSGFGKTTLLFNLIQQDILNGEGVAVLDPHGDLIERILGIIPEERIQDVILLDPSDEQFSVGFNILSAHSDFEKTLLASDLVSVFQRLSTSWGDQMASVLNNAILAFLESSEGGTLADLRRFLLDAAWRKQFLRTVQDPDIVYYWEKGFPQLGGNKSIGPVLTRLETFLAPKPIRYMVSQRENKLNFADITDSGKIFLAKLPQGQMGRENAWLLGSLLVSKFQQTAMARQRMRAEERRPFWLYVDEFQNFMTPSMAEILSGARKYRLGLILAHQDLNQLRREPDVASAVLSNACTRVVFRVSDGDAKALESGFTHFTARELQNLDIGDAICRIERSDADFNLSVPHHDDGDEAEAGRVRGSAVAFSRERYAMPRARIEAELSRPVPPRQETVDDVRDEQKTEAAVPPPGVAPGEQLQKVVEPAAAPEPPPPRKSPPEISPVLGKGGEIHQTAQEEIKRHAEGLGFRASKEKQLPGTLESTDVLLERDGLTIAVEITVTSSLDDELRNIGKCLRAGVTQVAVIGLDTVKLAKIEAAARNQYGGEQGQRIQFFTQETFRRHLQEFALAPVPVPAPEPKQTTTKHKGWNVKTVSVNVSPEEAKEREEAMLRIMAGSVRRERNQPGGNPG